MKKSLPLLIAILLPLLCLGQSAHIGDILCTDGSIVRPDEYVSSGKVAEGIVFFIDNTDSKGWVVSLYQPTTSVKWSSGEFYGYDIPNLPNYSNARVAMYDLKGYENTDIIRREGSKYDFPAAWAVDFDNGWYLPSAGQLRYMFSRSPEINASLQITGGTIFNYYSNVFFWSSTEYTGCHAFDMSTRGSLGDYVKDNHVNYPQGGIGVRQIKDFQIPNPVHPTYHVGDLITNGDGSQGVLFYINPDQTEGWIVALNDDSAETIWGNGDIPELTNQSGEFPHGFLLDETDGFSNTGMIRRYQAGMNTAANAVDYENGWYLPTAGQLSILFGALPFIESQLLTHGTTLAQAEYWSSSEADESNAFTVSFSPFIPSMNTRSGYFTLQEKTSYYPVRAVRNIHLTDPPQPTPSIVYTEFSLNACNSYTWNNITYSESGDYQQTFTSAQGCDSIVTLHLTINSGPEVGEIQGPEIINYNTYDDFTYSIDTVPNAYGYEWHIDNNWPLTSSPDSPLCIVGIYTNGNATLTVRIYGECGVTERSLLIHHDLEPLPVIGTLQKPNEICNGDPIALELPELNNAESFGWEISPDENFNNPVDYTGQNLDETYNDWFLRLWASNGEGTVYSNPVRITINIGSEVGEIQGPEIIYYAAFNDFTYSIDPVPDALGYEWHIDNTWPLSSSPNSPQCTVGVYTKDKATLTVRIYRKCGVTERSLLIRHDLEPGLTVFPNPNDGAFKISLYGLEGETVVEVYNYLGQRIDLFTVHPTVTGFTFPYSLKGKACGMYFISITNNHRHYTKKVVKKTSADYGMWSWY